MRVKKIILRILRGLFIAPFITAFLYSVYIGLFDHALFIFTEAYGFDAFLLTMIGLAVFFWKFWAACIIGIIITSIGLTVIRKKEAKLRALCRHYDWD